MYYQVFSRFYRKAAQKMVVECERFIPQKAKILDLGCGSGVVGQEFQTKFRADLIGVDVKDLRVVPIKFELIKNSKLSFPDNFFDVVLINFVLHHADYPVDLLKEAVRVTNNKIIIYEDLPEGFFQS